jgi:predicted amidohydrolase YtcJ
MQLQWAERDTYTMDYLRPYIGRRRWRRLYPAGSLWDAGARVCGGSDWPVDPLLPFRQIEMGVNRIADEVYGGYPYPLNPEQGLALRASIAMHTKHAAFQLHQETRTGSLRPGMAADLVVLDRNLFEVPLRDVSTTQVLMTLVRGDVVHLSPGLV